MESGRSGASKLFRYLWALPYLAWRWKSRLIIGGLLLGIALAWQLWPEPERPFTVILPNGVKIESHCMLRFHEEFPIPFASLYEGYHIFWRGDSFIMVKTPPKAPDYYEKDCLGDW